MRKMLFATMAGVLASVSFAAHADNTWVVLDQRDAKCAPLASLMPQTPTPYAVEMQLRNLGEIPDIKEQAGITGKVVTFTIESEKTSIIFFTANSDCIFYLKALMKEGAIQDPNSLK